MPTYSYGTRMNDAQAAEVIRKAFPRRGPLSLFLPRNKKCWTSVHTVCDALFHARLKCRCEGLERCIQWAYEQGR